MAQVFGIVGWQNSGKTTLIEELIDLFSERGLTVSTVKHAHHAFDIDKPGKDSHRHRKAGAKEVLIASDARWALMHELRSEDQPQLEALVAHLAPADIILAEGFKSHPHPKLQVIRDPSNEILAASDPTVRALVYDPALSPPSCSCPTIPRHDVTAIAALILGDIAARRGA